MCTSRDLMEGLSRALTISPEDVCLIGPDGTRRTWRELADDVRAWQNWLGSDANAGRTFAVRLDLSFNSVALMVAAVTRPVRVAWLPLKLPAAREQEIVENLGEDTLLVDESSLAQALEGDMVTVAPEFVWDDHAKFIYFTSGSEGVPKAVQVGMSAIRNRIEWMWDDYAFRPSDRVVVQKPFSFVASYWEVLGTLLAGTTGILLTSAERSRPDRFFDRLAIDEATHLFATPPAILGLCEIAAGQDAHLTSLRMVCSSADNLTGDVARKLFTTAPSARLFNLYGATETSANTTIFEVPRHGAIPDQVPLGAPIRGTRIIVRDAHGDEVAFGQEGRICIQGVPVADGYLVNGRLTPGDDAFFTWADGVREMRTGDLGFVQEDVLTLTGRLDNAVNVSGYKIHLEEIESAARRLAGSADQCGAVYHNDTKEEYLALVIPDTWEPLVTVARLGEVLPPYMVPQRIIPTPSVPRVRTGKVDRRGCLTLVTETARATAEISPAHHEFYERVCALWAAALGEGLRESGDDFFSAGGDSLRAVRFITSIRKEFGVRVPLRGFYADPSISFVVDLLTPAEEDHVED